MSRCSFVLLSVRTIGYRGVLWRGGGRGTGVEPSPRAPTCRKVTQPTASAIALPRFGPMVAEAREGGPFSFPRGLKRSPPREPAQRSLGPTPAALKCSNISELSWLRKPSVSPGDQLSRQIGRLSGLFPLKPSLRCQLLARCIETCRRALKMSFIGVAAGVAAPLVPSAGS